MLYRFCQTYEQTLNVPLFSLGCRTQTTLRHILGGRVLQECVENREAIAAEVEEITGRVATDWGVKVNQMKVCANFMPGN